MQGKKKTKKSKERANNAMGENIKTKGAYCGGGGQKKSARAQRACLLLNTTDRLAKVAERKTG